MKRIRPTALLAATVLVLAACSSSTTSSPSVAPTSPTVVETSSGIPSLPPGQAFTQPKVGAMTTYTDTDNGFSIDTPKNWAQSSSTTDAACISTICFAAPAQQDQIPAVIMVSVYSDQSTSSLQTAWNTVRQLQTQSLGVKPKTVAGTQGDTTLAGQPAKTATYTMTWGLIPATMQQQMTLDGTTPVMVTVISATDIWDGLQPTFTSAFESFTLTG
jgi:ABC-type phosphate/phosphonate transport system substrate-binding protein